MPAFNELVEKYKKRRHDTVVDAVTTGLSMAESVTADLGLLEDTGILTDTLETVKNVRFCSARRPVPREPEMLLTAC